MFFQSRFQASEPPSRALISCFKYSSGQNGIYQLHCHSYYEICYILSGERYELYGGKKYRVGAGSLFLIPPLTVHGNENITPVNDIILQFSVSFLSMLSASVTPEMKLMLAGGMPYTAIEDGSAAQLALLGLGESSDRYLQMFEKTGNSDIQQCAAIEYRRNGLVLELFSALLDSGAAFLDKELTNLTSLMKVDKVINYIIDHIGEIPDLNTAAEMSDMGYYAFSRLFKEAAGMKYSEYCNAIRIGHAEGLLMNTDMQIAEIGAQIGIDTPSYFTKLFRQIIGCSPAEYRKMYKKTN